MLKRKAAVDNNGETDGPDVKRFKPSVSPEIALSPVTNGVKEEEDVGHVVEGVKATAGRFIKKVLFTLLFCREC